MTNTQNFTSSVVVAAKVAAHTVAMDAQVVYNGTILGAAVALSYTADKAMDFNDKKEVLLEKIDRKFDKVESKLAALNARLEAKRAAKRKDNVIVADFNGQAVA